LINWFDYIYNIYTNYNINIKERPCDKELIIAKRLLTNHFDFYL